MLRDRVWEPDGQMNWQERALARMPHAPSSPGSPPSYTVPEIRCTFKVSWRTAVKDESVHTAAGLRTLWRRICTIQYTRANADCHRIKHGFSLRIKDPPGGNSVLHRSESIYNKWCTASGARNPLNSKLQIFDPILRWRPLSRLRYLGARRCPYVAHREPPEYDSILLVWTVYYSRGCIPSLA